MQKQATSSSVVTAKLSPLGKFLDKTYVLDCSEKYGWFLKELGVRKNVRIGAMETKPRVTLSRNNDDYHLITSYPEVKDVTVKFKLGEVIQRRRPDGSVATSVFHITNNTLVEEQQVDHRTVIIERSFAKEDLTVTMQVGDVKCRRLYILSKSKHSIGTETSRRSSLWRTPTPEEAKPVPEVTSILEKVLTPESESEEEKCY